MISTSARIPLTASKNDKLRRPELAYQFRPPGGWDARTELGGLARFGGLIRYRTRARRSARFDTNCLGGLHGLGGLLDRQMQHTLVEMSFDGSLFRLEG